MALMNTAFSFYVTRTIYHKNIAWLDTTWYMVIISSSRSQEYELEYISKGHGTNLEESK